MESTQGHTHILTSKGCGNGTSERSLSDSRRTIQANDGRLQVTAQLQDGEMLQDTLLHLLQSVVVLVQHLLCVRQVQIVGRIFIPGETEQSLQVIELHIVIRRLRIGAFQLGQFPFERTVDFLIPFLLGGSLLQFSQVLVLRISPQLILDVLHLLLEEVFALLLVQVFLGTHLNVGLQLGKLHLTLQITQEAVSTVLQRIFLEQLFLLLHTQWQIGTDEVDKEHLAVDVLDCKSCFSLYVIGILDELHGKVLTSIHQHLELHVSFFREALLQLADCAKQEILFGSIMHFQQLETLHTLQNDGGCLVWHFEHTHNLCYNAYGIQVFQSRTLHLGTQLTHCTDGLSFLVCMVYKTERGLTSYGNGKHYSREQHHIA